MISSHVFVFVYAGSVSFSSAHYGDPESVLRVPAVRLWLMALGGIRCIRVSYFDHVYVVRDHGADTGDLDVL